MTWFAFRVLLQVARPHCLGTIPGMARRQRAAQVRPDQSFKGRQFTVYAGLTPSPYASGDRRRERGISKGKRGRFLARPWVRGIAVHFEIQGYRIWRWR
ncbi:transposase [Paracraurococcus lichenis]|uniref:transposase n=1 Tax=Paracraurococcus lichenis TaxID=3064888 RepID=UPI00351CD919